MSLSLHRAALVISVVAGLSATVTAQQAVPRGSKTSSKVQAKTVIITGCVAQGVDADHYVLANAVRREQPPSSISKAGTSPTVSSDRSGAIDRTGPYDLQGGEFKAHLGHTVEVTGTSGSTSKVPGTTTGDAVTEKKPVPAFNVLSVKMVSASCS